MNNFIHGNLQWHKFEPSDICSDTFFQDCYYKITKNVYMILRSRICPAGIMMCIYMYIYIVFKALFQQESSLKVEMLISQKIWKKLLVAIRYYQSSMTAHVLSNQFIHISNEKSAPSGKINNINHFKLMQCQEMAT